jgi:antirestriction protein ArdC
MNVKQIVIERIQEELKQGRIPWQSPYLKGKDGQTKCNFISGHSYRGTNELLLAYNQDTYYMTFKQAQEIGAQIKKGAKSEIVTFWKMLETADRSTGEKKTVPILNYYRVFGVSQVDFSACEEKYNHYITKRQADIKHNPFINDIEQFLYYTQASIRHERKDLAYYSPVFDYINMPPINTFNDNNTYYEVMFHELTHWTGHESRNKRIPAEVHKRSEEYSKEELVAELGSCFLSAEFNLQVNYKNSASYIQSWSSFIKDNSNALFSASTEASKAVEYLKELTVKNMEAIPEPVEPGTEEVMEAPEEPAEEPAVIAEPVQEEVKAIYMKTVKNITALYLDHGVIGFKYTKTDFFTVNTEYPELIEAHINHKVSGFILDKTMSLTCDFYYKHISDFAKVEAEAIPEAFKEVEAPAEIPEPAKEEVKEVVKQPEPGKAQEVKKSLNAPMLKKYITNYTMQIEVKKDSVKFYTGKEVIILNVNVDTDREYIIDVNPLRTNLKKCKGEILFRENKIITDSIIVDFNPIPAEGKILFPDTIPDINYVNGLCSAASNVINCASTDTIKAVFHAVCFVDGKLIATDSRRLAVTEFPEIIDCELVIDRGVIDIALRDKLDCIATITDDKCINYAVITNCKDITIISREVDGKYPNYKQIIPTENLINVSLNTPDLKKYLSTKVKTDRITWEGDTLTSRDSGQSIKVNVKAPFKIAFLAVLFREALTEHIMTVTFAPDLAQYQRPAIFKSDKVIQVVMPIKLKSSEEEQAA